MKPAFVVGGLYSRSNGVAWIMRELAAGLGRINCPVDVYAADCYGRGAESIGEIFEPPTRWHASRGLWLGGLSWSPGLKAVLRSELKRADVVHNHSVWMLPNSYSSRIAKTLNKPVVITAHGTLEPWALRNSGWKKQLVGRWFQFKDLREATCLHVNSRSEMDGVRELGYTNPIAVLPNGVNLPEWDLLPEPTVFTERFTELQGKRLMLFMARVHKKKGLQHLLEGWARVKHLTQDWHLVVAGPDDGFLISSQKLVEQLGISRSVLFTGALDGVQKKAALAAASGFAQPSFSEGFSMSIVEAMACRLPVLMTPGCNFEEAFAANAAVRVQPETESTAAGLEFMLTMTDEQRAVIGENARRLVEADYTWDRIALKTRELYEWMISSSNQPDFVCHG